MMSLSPDQQRFLYSNLAALALAAPYRYVPQKLRNHYNYLPGIAMVYYCFGGQPANVFILFAAISYLLCKHLPGRYVQRVVMCVSLAFLSYAHLSRQIIDYGGYTIDISGPFMIAVQKVTSLGFCIFDGNKIQTSDIIETVARDKPLSAASSSSSPHASAHSSTVSSPEPAAGTLTNENSNSNGHQLKNNKNNSNNEFKQPYQDSNNNQDMEAKTSATPIESDTNSDQLNDSRTLTKLVHRKLSPSSRSQLLPPSPDHLDTSTSLSPNDSLKCLSNTKIAKITLEQQQYAVQQLPSFFEFMGYFFHFPSILCGPIMYFNDYREFINYPQDKDLPPGRFTAVLKKLAISTTCTLLILNLMPRFEVEFLRSASFLEETNFFMRFFYLLIFTMLHRLKYYVAWHLGEAVSNLTGFGFSGYDPKTRKPQWNLIANMDIFKFETCLNYRDAILAWNKSTQSWLRRTAYERAPPKYAVLATYCLSAFWHGFYPGYYMTFLGGALFTYAARSGRRMFRPMFQKGTTLPRVYDAITFILTRLTLAYVAFPFVILDWENNLAIYKSLYFSLHFLAIGMIVLGSVVRKY